MKATGDFNGDGLTDLYLYPADQQGRSTGSLNDYVWLAKGDGTFTALWLGPNSGITGSAWTGYTVKATGDFNGDGLTDLYLYPADLQGRSTGSLNDYVWLAKGDGTFTALWLGPNSGITSTAWTGYTVKATGDFNGDGLTDVYLYPADQQGRSTGSLNDYVWLAKGDGTFTSVYQGTTSGITGTAWTGYTVKATGDFNGDGLTDVYLYPADVQGRSTGSLNDYVWLAKGDGTFTSVYQGTTSGITGTAWTGYTVKATGDFNGDGLTDVYLYPADVQGRSTGSLNDYVWLAKGDGTFTSVYQGTTSGITGTAWTGYTVKATGDFNGDGLTDVYLYPADVQGRSTGSLNDYVWLAKGDGTFTSVYQGTTSGITGTAWTGYTVKATGDFNGDGLTDVYLYPADVQGRSTGSLNDYVWLSDWSFPDLLAGSVNGHGLGTELVYKPLTDGSVYTKGSGAVYPVQDQVAAARVVSQIKSDNGVGGQNVQSYSYAGLRAHLKGIGSLGFETMTVMDEATGIKTESVYGQDWANHKQGLLLSSKTVLPDSTVLSEKTLTWSARFFPTVGSAPLCFRFSPSSTTVTRDLNGAFVSRVQEATSYDDYGFPTTLKVSTSNQAGTDSHSKITTNTYTHDAANWILGRLTAASVTHRSGTGTGVDITATVPDKVRTSSFTYGTDGLLASETVEPGNALFHTKTYTRNGFGATTSVTETWGSTASDGIAATSRTTSFVYDAKSRYRETETNPLNHSQTTAYHPVLGLKTSSTGPNGLTTSWSYDVFGRVTLETRADTSTTATSLDFCGGAIACPTGAVYRSRALASGGAETMVFLDKLNREIRKQTRLDGKWNIVDTSYDALGRVASRTEPYFAGDTQYATTIQYDLIGRPTLTTRPDTSTQSVSYNGLTTTSTNELGQTKTVTKDVMGREVTVTDALSQSIAYSYDPLGQMLTMTGGGTTSSYAYDVRGNKVSDTDPDKGTWTYAYNALELLVTQTDAKGQVTEMTYDVLGRVLTRIDDATAATPAARTATWTYDTATKGVGKLHTAARGGYLATHAYDTLGRPSSTTETIGGSAFTSSTTYDAVSRPDTVTYPSGLAIKNVYDAQGVLLRVENNANSYTFWERLGVDSRGNVTRFRLGNGVETTRSYGATTGYLLGIASLKGLDTIQDLDYSYDALGNLTGRTDTRLNQSETFLYDNLNRVTQVSTTVAAATTTVTVTYGATGNIASKSDVGAYTYGQVHGGCSSGFAGPHAVTGVTGTKTASYCYDRNGNMVSGDGRTVSYTAFDKPETITKAGNTITVTYGPDRARYKRVDQTASGTTTTVYAAGKSYELIALSSGEVRKKHYIGDFAVVTQTTSSGGSATTATSFLHRDHLGSVDTITDGLGAVSQRLSFDAWGKRREINWQAMSEPAILAFSTTLTTRGFTGHEMLDPVGLVHMNGRVYDPELGRFLSADPFVQDITNLQSLNRYAYVLNNPLSYTDPSGFFFKRIFRAIGKFFSKVFRAVGRAFQAVGRVVKKVLQNPIVRAAVQIVGCALTAAATAGAGCAAIAGALTAAAGGSVVDAIKATAFAFVQIGVWDAVGVLLDGASALVKTAVHGVVSGALDVAQGGNFVQGFVAGAIGKAGGLLGRGAFGDATGNRGVFLRTAVAAGAGCAAASATGGKCANGALTAGMAHLFNQETRRATLGTGSASIAAAGRAAAGGIRVGSFSGFIVRGIGRLLAGPTTFFSVLLSPSRTEDLHALYRAVSRPELQDIRSCKCFRPSFGSMEAKLFAKQLGGAQFFFRKLPEASNIVRAHINTTVYDSLFHFDPDGIPSVAVYPEQLGVFNAAVQRFGGPQLVQ